MASSSSTSEPGLVRILLVEDDLDQAHLVKFLLEAGGDYTVTLAQDGDRALALVRRGGWDLLVTDLNLPGADGTAVVEAARERIPNLPILATTGYTGPQYSQRAMERGADAVLVKPLDRDELLQRVRSLVEEGRPARNPVSNTPLPTDGIPLDSGNPAGAVGGPGRQGASSSVSPEPHHEPLQVLAVSVYPGEVEAGCGGVLLRHRELGDQVVILHLNGGSAGESAERDRKAAREAGRRLGVRTFVGNADAAEGRTGELERLAGGAVREIRPDVLYVPTRNHFDSLHRITQVAALAAAGGVDHRFAYDAGEVTASFAPDLFVPLSESCLDRKVDAMIPYQSKPAAHLAADFIRTSARYWSRFTDGRATEALERLDGTLPFPDLTLAEREPSQETA